MLRGLDLKGPLASRVVFGAKSIWHRKSPALVPRTQLVEFYPHPSGLSAAGDLAEVRISLCKQKEKVARSANYTIKPITFQP